MSRFFIVFFALYHSVSLCIAYRTRMYTYSYGDWRYVTLCMCVRVCSMFLVTGLAWLGFNHNCNMVHTCSKHTLTYNIYVIIEMCWTKYTRVIFRSRSVSVWYFYSIEYVLCRVGQDNFSIRYCNEIVTRCLVDENSEDIALYGSYQTRDTYAHLFCASIVYMHVRGPFSMCVQFSFCIFSPAAFSSKRMEWEIYTYILI